MASQTKSEMTNSMKEIKEKKEDLLTQWETASETLDQWEMRLIMLRYEGFTYKEIASMLRDEFPSMRLKFTDDYLRKKLYHLGDIRPQFDLYRKMMNIESLELGQNALQSAHNAACSTIVALLGKKYASNIRLSASKEILDRNIGKAIQKIEETIDPGESARQDIRDLIEAVKNGDAEKLENNT